MAMISFPSIFICCVIRAVFSQTPAIENIVINQSSGSLLSCPVTDCAYVQWNLVTAAASVLIIGTAGNVYPRYQRYYAINTTAGYCTLIVLQEKIHTASGHINCQDLRTGLTVKKFHIFVISDGPSCNVTGTGSDGYATDGHTLSYQCLMTYGGIGTSGYVDMTWLNTQATQQTSKSPFIPNQVSSNFTVVAVKPSVSQYTCRSSFGNKNISSAAIITKDCVVNPIDVKYAVTYVKLSREGQNFVPGTNITCTADGVPPPTYRWVDSTSGVTYVSGSNILVNNASLAWYHCEASNSLNTAPLKSDSIMFNSSVNPDDITDALAVQADHIYLVIVSLSVIISVIVIVIITPCIVVKLRRVKLQRAKNDKIYHEPECYVIPPQESRTAIGEYSLGKKISSKPEKELTTSVQHGNISVLYEEIRNLEEANYEHLLDNRTRTGSQVNGNVAENKYTTLMKQSKHYQNDGRF